MFCPLICFFNLYLCFSLESWKDMVSSCLLVWFFFFFLSVAHSILQNLALRLSSTSFLLFTSSPSAPLFFFYFIPLTLALIGAVYSFLPKWAEKQKQENKQLFQVLLAVWRSLEDESLRWCCCHCVLKFKAVDDLYWWRLNMLHLVTLPLFCCVVCSVVTIPKLWLRYNTCLEYLNTDTETIPRRKTRTSSKVIE